MGMAIFAMFFGSGNLVFPILLGVEAKQQTPMAMFGLFLTAICVPFLGVLSMVLLRGNFQEYFRWLGKWPKLVMCTVIIAMIGPFGVLPRCITIAHASVINYFPKFPLIGFSALAVVGIYAAAIKKGRLLEILGKILSPLLLGILLLIIVKGFFVSHSHLPSSYTTFGAFTRGLFEGYNTMDLLATIFFTKAILHYFDDEPMKHRLKTTLKAGIIGMGLLALIYIAFTLLGSLYSKELQTTPPEQLLMHIATTVLGPVGSLLASISVALACFTTALALAEVSSEFLKNELFKKLSKKNALLIVLTISLCISTFEFSGIAKILTPVLQVFYPFLIVLTFLNIIVKVRHERKLKQTKHREKQLQRS